MIIKGEKCLISKAECNKVSSCRYLLERFGVRECEPILVKKTIIDVKHKKEMEERKELLAKGNYNTGNNYNEKLDRTYKDAVIDKQAKGKREC